MPLTLGPEGDDFYLTLSLEGEEFYFQLPSAL